MKILGPSHKAQSFLTIGVLLLFACATSAGWFLWEQRDAESWLRHTFDVESGLSKVQIFTGRAELGRRKYLLTGDPKAIASYEKGRRLVVPQLAKLTDLVADNVVQERRSQALRHGIVLLLDDMRRSIELYRAGDRPAALRMVADQDPRLGKVIEAMRADEERLLGIRKARADQLERWAATTLTLSAILIILIATSIGGERRRRLVALSEANALLDRARQSAEDAVRVRNSFLANMSHEIRTPMNGVIGFTELLLASHLDEAQHQHAQLILDSGRAMMRLLNDILDLSKLEAGQMSIAEAEFDLPHALRACARLIAPAIKQNGVWFSLELAPDLPKHVVGDSLRLRQIVLNLLGNAAKFTSEGEVTLRASVDNGTLRLAVKDTGIGIAAQHQARIFEHFVQADPTIARRFGGTGLGLAISAQLATLMGGRLDLESIEGVGTTVFLTLPCLVPTAAASEAETLSQVELTDDRDVSSLRILVAEDHDVNQLLILAMLDRLGISADLAKDGAEAITCVADAANAGRPYDLVLMDMQMPITGGIEATRQLRAMGHDSQSLPILALTANAYAEDIATCLKAGMQAHLAKPLQIAELSGAIRRWTAKPAQRQAPAAAERFSKELRERYRGRRGEFLRMIDRLAGAGTIAEDDVAALGDLLHKFLGTAELFGDVDLAREARALEEGLGHWPSGERAQQIRRAAEAIKSCG